jgi:hypothetical protein
MSKESNAVIAKDLAVAIDQSGKVSFSVKDANAYGEKVAEMYLAILDKLNQGKGQ